MSQKKPRNDAVFQFRCLKTDLDRFRAASERDQAASLAAWIINLLRQRTENTEKSRKDA